MSNSSRKLPQLRAVCCRPYLDASTAVREAGGVASLEVQTAYAGSDAFYAFEEQGVVPDIVVRARIGQRHPIGAWCDAGCRVVRQRMEFFSTFAATRCRRRRAGRLDVVETTVAGRRAAVGEHLLSRMRPWSRSRSPATCADRVSYIGVELYATRDANGDNGGRRRRQSPARRGLLIATDGPHHNVLKIRADSVYHRDADLSPDARLTSVKSTP